jgi:L-fucose mutarotase
MGTLEAAPRGAGGYDGPRRRGPMLTTTLLHPQILAALATAGHGSTVLIADGNYPFSTGANPAAERVYLNLVPGVVDAVTALRAVLSAVPVDEAITMVPDDGGPVEIQAEFARLLGDVPMTTAGRFPFYDLARDADLALVIATAEQRIYGNVLLRIGVRAYAVGAS